MQQKNHPDFTILFIGLIILIAALCSCSRNGYGCHGTGKYITRVR